jgi:hypothetical protein
VPQALVRLACKAQLALLEGLEQRVRLVLRALLAMPVLQDFKGRQALEQQVMLEPLESGLQDCRERLVFLEALGLQVLKAQLGPVQLV